MLGEEAESELPLKIQFDRNKHEYFSRSNWHRYENLLEINDELENPRGPNNPENSNKPIDQNLASIYLTIKQNSA